MPGFSEECTVGAHGQCAMGQQCRCGCHPWTQALLKQPVKRGDPKGGIRRKLKGKITEAVQALPEVEAIPELKSLCPGCKAEQRGTDVFCRSCGARLQVGKQCLGCGAPQEPTDNYCWQCSLKCGEKPPEPSVEAEQPQPSEDRIVALVREADKRGIHSPALDKLRAALTETMVP